MEARYAMDKLNSFESADKIAEFFKSRGVRGDVQDEFSCPITNWVSDVTGMTVTTAEVVTVFGYKIGEEPEVFELSTAARAFIELFDEGNYEFLETYYDDEYESEYYVDTEFDETFGL